MAAVGEPVCALDSSHKQCYELLVIGRKLGPKCVPSPDLSVSSALVVTEDKDRNKTAKIENPQKSNSLDNSFNQTEVDQSASLSSIDDDILESNFKSSAGDGFIRVPVQKKKVCEDAVNGADNLEAVDMRTLRLLPPDFVFASIPCAIHSKKPNISGNDIFKKRPK